MSKKTIAAFSLALLLCLSLPAASLAANANVSGYWSVGSAPTINLTTIYTITFSDGGVYQTTHTTSSSSASLLFFPQITQYPDGTIYGSVSGSSNGSSFNRTLTGKVTNNVIIFTITTSNSLTSGDGSYDITSTTLRDFTGTVLKGKISGTGQISHSERKQYSPSMDGSTSSSVTTGAASGAFTFSVIFSGGGGGDIIIQPDPTTPLGDDPKTPPVGDPISPVTGNMHIISSDITIPGRNLNFEFIRTYNSLDKASGPLGWGWTHSYNIYLEENPLTGIVTIKDEQSKAFLFADKHDGSYLPQRGEFSTLTKINTKTNKNYTWTKKDGKQYIFDLSGRLLQIKDRNNNAILLSYDPSGCLIKVTDTVKRIINLSYDNQKRIIGIVDPSGRSFAYSYDSANNLVQVTNPNNVSVYYYYDLSHNITRKVNVRGNSTHFTYDSSNRCTSSTQEANINKTLLSFDTINNKTTVSDSKGYQTQYYYNADYLVTKTVNPQGGEVLLTWDTNLNLTRRTDELGRSVNFEYDAKGNLTRLIDAFGYVTAFTYEPKFNRIKSQTDAQGNINNFTYDLKGNLLNFTNPLKKIVSYRYNYYGQPILIINENGASTSIGYDTKGNIFLIRAPTGGITYYYYDSVGNMVKSVNPKRQVTLFTYDALNQLTQATYPDNSQVRFTYDEAGNKTSFIDQNGALTSYSYDPVHKITRVADPLGGVVNYTYDAEENLIAVSDQKNNQTTFVYDSLDRPVEQRDALGRRSLYNYDAAGNLISQTDPKGQNFSYQYDGLNRLIKLTYPGSQITYAYDSLGRRASLTDSQGTTNYTYDKVGRLLKEDGPLANDTLTYSYDGAGNRLYLTDPDGKVTRYIYTLAGQLSYMIDPQRKVTRYVYDLMGNLTNMYYPNGIYVTYAYNNMNRLSKLTRLVLRPYSKTEFTYTYDPAGRLARINSQDASVINYGYNAKNELISENRTGSVAYQASYSYDLAGNRIQMNRDGQAYSYTYNGLNQLVTEQSPVGQINYTYDLNGNLTQRTGGALTASFTYDSMNRLTRFNSSTTTEDYSYDGLGRRVVVNGARQVYDGLSVLLERTPSNVTAASYLRNHQAPGGIGGLIKKVVPRGIASVETYYLYDALGSVTSLNSSTGATLQSCSYDAFGQRLSPQGTVPDNHQFLTKETGGSGLIYFGARYYDSRIGRFITRDPSGMSDGPNLYLYCLNNPVNAVDLWGLDTYYVSYELVDPRHRPTGVYASHSFIATTNNGVVTDTFSWGLSRKGEWTHNNSQDYKIAQQAINERVGANWMGNESFDSHIESAYNRLELSDKGIYSLLFNNCKDHALKLIDEATKIQKEREGANKK